jgi:hypothetical protein
MWAEARSERYRNLEFHNDAGKGVCMVSASYTSVHISE